MCAAIRSCAARQSLNGRPKRGGSTDVCINMSSRDGRTGEGEDKTKKKVHKGARLLREGRVTRVRLGRGSRSRRLESRQTFAVCYCSRMYTRHVHRPGLGRRPAASRAMPVVRFPGAWSVAVDVVVVCRPQRTSPGRRDWDVPSIQPAVGEIMLQLYYTESVISH